MHIASTQSFMQSWCAKVFKTAKISFNAAKGSVIYFTHQFSKNDMFCLVEIRVLFHFTVFGHFAACRTSETFSRLVGLRPRGMHNQLRLLAPNARHGTMPVPPRQRHVENTVHDVHCVRTCTAMILLQMQHACK